jgi:hypothetical protein
MPAGNSSLSALASSWNHPGTQAESSLTVGCGVNRGDPETGVKGLAHPRTSVTEDEGNSGRKSEPPIVAMIGGNAPGAKGGGLR